MKKILFIPAQYLPVPAVSGGAVEVLLTSLIEENEKYQRASFFVISKSDDKAKRINYKNTKLFFFDRKISKRIKFFFIKFFRKLLFNRLTHHFIKNSKYGFKELTYFGYFCDTIAKKIKPDIIISESYDRIHQLWPLVRRFGNNNFYYHLHYTKEEDTNIRIMFPNTIAISQFVLNHWVKDKTIKGKNYVLYNGIDLEPFQEDLDSKKRSIYRRNYGIKDEDFVVLFVGRLRPHKGVLELLRAFDKLDDNGFKLILAGEFLSESKEHSGDEHMFEQQCLNIIKSNKNIIRVGNVPYSLTPNIYHISDIQIIPSMWEEGAGLVAIEGMASGLPLIITNSGGMPEYTGKDCAIILERNTQLIENIAISILKLRHDNDLRTKMSLSGKERSKAFSKEQYYKLYMDFLLKEDNLNEK